MSAGDCSRAFTKLTAEGDEQFPPFRWQLRLLRRLIDGDLPDAIDVPTGLGKTAVMALWLIARAEGADLPRRLVYVVDRRAVVDQATRFAEQLRTNLKAMPPAFVNGLGLSEGANLPISTLRGGFADNRDWLEDPSRPAIVVGTVDMVGSRLLFEGYGVSRRMRPYHAGLLGADTLVVLDEAHLCPPFEALLRQIAAQRDGKFGPADPSCPATGIVPPFRLMSLSATGRETGNGNNVFRLEAEDLLEPIVHERMTACKRLQVSELQDSRTLTAEIARRAIELGTSGPPTRVLIYCHSRKDAIDVKTRIDKEIKPRRKAKSRDSENNSGVSELLVGERRVYERRNLEHWLERYGFLGGARSAPGTPAFLIATSAGEVGIDLDADHMVCDLVAHERMVQRLGRVNRRGGKKRNALIDVFAAPPPLGPNASAATRERNARNLKAFNAYLAALRLLLPDSDDRLDGSPAALAALRSHHPDSVQAATTPAPLHPELTRPLLDAWCMTSLERHAGRPEVAPWLRGWEQDEEPHTSVVWRRHVPHRRVGDESTAPSSMVAQFFQCAPVHASEKLEALRSHVLDWLLKRVKDVQKRPETHEIVMAGSEIAALAIDRVGELAAKMTVDDLHFLGRPASKLSSTQQREQKRRKGDLEQALAGATLVVDARIGGVTDGMLDEKSEAEAEAADGHWRSIQEGPAADAGRPMITFRVQPLATAEGDEGLRNPELEGWCHVRTFETAFDIGGSVRRGLAVYKWADGASDEDSRSILSAPQSLHDHAAAVTERARALAQRLHLSAEEVEAVTTAARFHDDGKATERWQHAMNAPEDGRPYAKTRGGGNWHLLEGYRHEFGSLIAAERTELSDGIRDLVLHLIAAHHGYARPLITPAGCEDGPPSLLEAKAGDAALRFARLQKRYGPWGLAWREAILRAADQDASKRFDQTVPQPRRTLPTGNTPPIPPAVAQHAQLEFSPRGTEAD